MNVIGGRQHVPIDRTHRCSFIQTVQQRTTQSQTATVGAIFLVSLACGCELAVIHGRASRRHFNRLSRRVFTCLREPFKWRSACVCDCVQYAQCENRKSCWLTMRVYLWSLFRSYAAAAAAIVLHSVCKHKNHKISN